MNGSENRLVNYVNLEMSQIHSHVSELYEALMDQEPSDVVNIIEELIKQLRVIQKSNK